MAPPPEISHAELRRSLVRQLVSLHHFGVKQLPRPAAGAPLDLEGGALARPPLDPPTEEIRVAYPPPQGGHRLPETSTPAMPRSSPATDLEVLSREVASCRRCVELAESRTQTVFGVGDPAARLCFFGEAPGADEDRQGEPFVGRAGRLLTDIIEKGMKLTRQDVYILNVLKCRPPGNRNPSGEESDNCRPFFERQLEIIQPQFICCLGTVAAQTLLGSSETIGRLRGRFHRWRDVQVVATYHPAYLLRNPSAKTQVWEDIQMLMGAMGMTA